jgi:hypothetical protein
VDRNAVNGQEEEKMNTEIDLLSLILSLGIGVTLAAAVVRLIKWPKGWVGFIITVICAGLSPFIGVTTWLIGIGEGAERQGINLSYFLLAFWVTLMVVYLVRLLYLAPHKLPEGQKS